MSIQNLFLVSVFMYDSTALPTSSQTVGFPTTALSYAGGPSHNSYAATGPTLTKIWNKGLAYALPLTGDPLDSGLYATEVAAQMTHFAFGVGSGVSAVKGIVYAAGDDRTVNAFNATTGKLLWRFRANNHNLGLAQVVWSQPFSGVASSVTGYSGASLAMDVITGLVVGSVVVDADMLLNSAHVQVFALDAATGNQVWTQGLDPGAVPSGFVAPTPMLSGGRVYLANPLVGQVVALDMLGGGIAWKTAVVSSAGLYAWGPGCLVGGSKLIQPMGSDLYTFDATTGAVLKRYTVGGTFTYNHPTVLGGTLYIGNSFG